MPDMYLNPMTNGLVFSLGNTQSITDPKSLKAQKIRNRLMTIKGEWFLDTSFGLDYYGIIWAKNTPQALIDAHIQQTILLSADPGDSIQNYTSSVNSSTRTLSVACQVVTANGSSVTNINVGT